MGFNLKGIRILITAGPTWVPIDPVRVISNIASGETGCECARKARARGADVTLLLGPIASHSGLVHPAIREWPVRRRCGGIKVIRYTYFNELRRLLARMLSGKKFHVVIHSAAVSDYQPVTVCLSKIPSHRKTLVLKLKATVKLVDAVKRSTSAPVLAAFKYEPNHGRRQLIQEARALMQRCNAEIIVANNNISGSYAAYFVTHHSVQGPYRSKALMTDALLDRVSAFIKRG